MENIQVIIMKMIYQILSLKLMIKYIISLSQQKKVTKKMKEDNLKKKKLMKIIERFNLLLSDKIFFKIYILFTKMTIIQIQKEKF